MIESIPLITVLIAAAVLVVLCVPRLAGYWYTHTAWTISGADLGAKFKGLLLFGKHGSYLALSPKDEAGSISFTKHLVGGGETVFKLRVTSERLNPDRIRVIEKKIDALPGRICRSHFGLAESGDLEIDISGPVVSDPVGMEGVATGVLVALGFGSSQKYRIRFEGPTDESAVAEYYSRS